MYKVFIDNIPVIYNVQDEASLLSEFNGYKFIEAAGGIVRDQHRYLFIRRLGLWDIPKGKLNKNESPHDAAVREIEEECGLTKPVIVKHLINTYHTYRHKEKNVLKKTYWYLLESSEKNPALRPQTEEDITEVKFFSATELPIVEAETYLSILEVIEELRKENI